jgi:glutaminase
MSVPRNSCGKTVADRIGGEQEQRGGPLSHLVANLGDEGVVDADIVQEPAKAPLAAPMATRASLACSGAFDRIYCDPAEAVELYTRQSCLSVTARDLAIMGATLADGGVNPVTREQVLDADAYRYTLAIMATAGLYETSGDWLYEIGLPGKSGIGGGIVTVAPGKGGLGTFAPRLDRTGNSIKGRLVADFLSRRLGLDLFASEPEG